MGDAVERVLAVSRIRPHRLDVLPQGVPDRAPSAVRAHIAVDCRVTDLSNRGTAAMAVRIVCLGPPGSCARRSGQLPGSSRTICGCIRRTAGWISQVFGCVRMRIAVTLCELASAAVATQPGSHRQPAGRPAGRQSTAQPKVSGCLCMIPARQGAGVRRRQRDTPGDADVRFMQPRMMPGWAVSRPHGAGISGASLHRTDWVAAREHHLPRRGARDNGEQPGQPAQTQPQQRHERRGAIAAGRALCLALGQRRGMGSSGVIRAWR